MSARAILIQIVFQTYNNDLLQLNVSPCNIIPILIHTTVWEIYKFELGGASGSLNNGFDQIRIIYPHLEEIYMQVGNRLLKRTCLIEKHTTVPRNQ